MTDNDLVWEQFNQAVIENRPAWFSREQDLTRRGWSTRDVRKAINAASGQSTSVFADAIEPIF